MKTRIILTAIGVLFAQCACVSSGYAASTAVKSDCASDARAAIAMARSALVDQDSPGDRLALECLVDAVAALEQKLQGLSNGSVPFDGQVYAPKGITVAPPKPPEGR